MGVSGDQRVPLMASKMKWIPDELSCGCLVDREEIVTFFGVLVRNIYSVHHEDECERYGTETLEEVG